jgi:hypothetical protein
MTKNTLNKGCDSHFGWTGEGGTKDKRSNSPGEGKREEVMENVRTFVVKRVFDMLVNRKNPVSVEEAPMVTARVANGIINEVVGEWLWIHK